MHANWSTNTINTWGASLSVRIVYFTIFIRISEVDEYPASTYLMPVDTGTVPCGSIPVLC